MTTKTVVKVPWRTLALPNEHGAWAFLLEPTLLGLTLAPTWAGLYLGLCALALLLLQHPLSLAASDSRRGKHYPRTRLALGFSLLYGLTAALLLALTLANTSGYGFLVPALLAVPLAVVQFVYDARLEGRKLLPELAGAVSIGALASALVMLGGWSIGLALVLWLLLAARTIPSVLYVRTRVRLERNQPAGVTAPLLAALLAVVVVVGLVGLELAPRLAGLAMLVLLLRAALGLSPWRGAAKPKAIGLRELGFGITTVLLIVAGYTLPF